MINVTYEASAASAPAAFKTAVASVVQYYESVITNPITVNITVGYGTINGQSLLSGALGESETFLSSFGYSTIKNALAGVDPAAAGSLPSEAAVRRLVAVTLAGLRPPALTGLRP